MEKEGIESPRFTSPQEELQSLREQVALKEKELENENREVPRDTTRAVEESIEESIEEHRQRPHEEVLAPDFLLSEERAGEIVLQLAPEAHDEQMSELMGILEEKGIYNTLKVVEKMNSPHIEDDFHRILVQYIKEGIPIALLKEKEPLWESLHMTLYEIRLPEARSDEIKEKSLKELLSSMEQFYAGMLSISDIKNKQRRHFTLEIAIAEGSSEIVFYASVPDQKKELFEKQILSLFSGVYIEEQNDDYNIFSEGGISAGSYATFKNNSIFPIKTYEQFDLDPLNVVLNVFSKIEHTGEGAAIQIVFHPEGDFYTHRYKQALEQLQKGVNKKEALDIAYTFGGEFMKVVKGFSSSGKKPSETTPTSPVDQTLIENIQQKISSPILSTSITVISSAQSASRADSILTEIESAFNQFENTQGNSFVFKKLKKAKLTSLFKDFSFRTFRESRSIPLNIKELTTLIHLPTQGVKTSPQFKQQHSVGAPAPIDIPQEGTLLGVNKSQNVETNVYITEEDRLRHLYIIGQTGTGKTTLLRNMITQDIKEGKGVCMIDPHGSDILDVLASIPPERYEDVIYFDPSYTERVMSINLLDYDRAYPEQKTFVVNELFSIFKKLYSDSPESMGPMFEQYFRNATMLVLEHPESGNTLLDVSRVLSDKAYRDLKLSRSTNPVVTQFWTEIATKAEGEASLQNIVPYITNKFDVFIANDFMRPLMSQQKSSFDFRKIMDEKKILLINLSKGRLGDSNAHLLGLIIIGKILMAALSRVDSVLKEMHPFYLYIDEFQNITTDSIATILSEARKYKLSLTVAHQFIAQLEEKIKDAVFGNVGSLVSFRVGREDAEFLEKQFEPVFKASDIVNINNYHAYVKLLAFGKPVKLFDIAIPAPQEGDKAKIEMLKNMSYEKYGRPREEVERDIQARYQK